MKVGAHISLSKRKVSQAVREAKQAGLQCAQIFAGTPYRLAVRKVDKADILDAREQTRDFPLFLHCSFPASLCTNKPGLEVALKKYFLAVDNYAWSYGARGFVTHVGSYGEGHTREEGIKKVRSMIEFLAPKLHTKLILENVAGLGTSLARTPEDLHEMVHGFPVDKVGVCWDTCHGYAQGVPCSTEAEVEDIITKVNGNISDRLALIHFNGVTPKVTFGSHLDRHDSLKTSANYSTLALRAWLKTDAPMIIEASKGRDYAEDMKFLREEELTVGLC